MRVLATLFSRVLHKNISLIWTRKTKLYTKIGALANGRFGSCSTLSRIASLVLKIKGELTYSKIIWKFCCFLWLTVYFVLYSRFLVIIHISYSSKFNEYVRADLFGKSDDK